MREREKEKGEEMWKGRKIEGRQASIHTQPIYFCSEIRAKEGKMRKESEGESDGGRNERGRKRRRANPEKRH